jgi:hypothetical protein
MTRNREIDYEDLSNCDHKPETPVCQDGEIRDTRSMARSSFEN